jgi:hypothetical protein
MMLHSGELLACAPPSSACDAIGRVKASSPGVVLTNNILLHFRRF